MNSLAYGQRLPSGSDQDHDVESDENSHVFVRVWSCPPAIALSALAADEHQVRLPLIRTWLNRLLPYDALACSALVMVVGRYIMS